MGSLDCLAATLPHSGTFGAGGFPGAEIAFASEIICDDLCCGLANRLLCYFFKLGFRTPFSCAGSGDMVQLNLCAAPRSANTGVQHLDSRDFAHFDQAMKL